jgi:copper transport protein
MGSLRGALRRGLLSAVFAAVLVVLSVSPAAAHAELVRSTPANGERVEVAPTEVRLTFTESVNLLDRGITLIDRVGVEVPTPDPVVDGHTVTWPMPADLPDGRYTVSWRVVSSDGHPVAGAFSFGVGAAAEAFGVAVPASTGPPATTAPWPVVTARQDGYQAFALVAGVAAFVMWCSAGSGTDRRLQLLVRCGLVGGLLATVAGLLVQGPYVAGLGMSELFDPQLVRETLSTTFGIAMVWRLGLYAAVAAAVWQLPRLVSAPASWLVPAGVAGIAVTVAQTGHGAASGRPVDLGVVTVHALTAGIWVGGLVVLVALARRVEREALHRFATLAMASVLALVATGALNSLRELDAVEQLWQTRYGLVLVAKLALVAGTLAAAGISRRRLQQQRVPLRSVRLESGMTVAVLVVTAVLSMTSPPPLAAATADGSATAGAGSPTAANAVVEMSLGDRGRAVLAVLPATTAGSKLRMLLTDPRGQRLHTGRVDLLVSSENRGLGRIPVPLTRRHGFWVADYRFPYPGVWTATLTVEDPGRTTVVTAGDLTISGR